MVPQVPTDGYGVLLLGEALGEMEAKAGAPFVGSAGFRLTRLLEWAGLDRARFHIANAVWCRPPNNRLDGEEYEKAAINHCRTAHWDHLLDQVSVVVPLGNVPLSALTGRKGILSTRGYVRPGPRQTHLVPTVHPSFIQRGQAKYSPAFINDVQKAVDLARTGLPLQQVDYLLDPSPLAAYEWALAYRRRVAADRSIRLAFDIETPDKADDEATSDESDPTFHIYRISFAYEPYVALSIPWTPEHMATIRLLLEGDGEKIVWNASFDCPRIRHNGVNINGLIHDGMVAWHVLHSDLPKGLGFVATFTCPWQPEWKHLSGSQPAFYNATDADVELRSMIEIEAELRRTGLWDVYDRDVLQMEPILVHMHVQGMPIDQTVRADRANKLANLLKNTQAELISLVPLKARRHSPPDGYRKVPTDLTDCVLIQVEASVKRCDRCGLINPLKPHFKTFKRPTPSRPQNPCAGASVVETTELIDRWARLDPFKPSRDQLIRYQEALNRPIPHARDPRTKLMKPSMDERAIKGLTTKYPDDKLYPLVLRYRELDKLAGTYIGRPAGD